jgi:hypothetical protein
MMTGRMSKLSVRAPESTLFPPVMGASQFTNRARPRRP